ncbi:ABC transporter substrate-binding protein [Sedimentibacter sp.]|uniref:ABC transporter substrate-binding protein n=1 Tax=Sedimentibacter sp. TaxID=1960295 RepID=UPI0028ABB04D|nr:ABC transporter substrate-binding protein [Sedimentibacter sp.]
MKLKKLAAVIMLIPMILSGCAQDAADTPDTPDKDSEKFVIGISQMMEHPALDASRQGFIDGLKEQGVNVEFLDQNAQGDTNNALMIAQKFVRDDVDLIFAIATPPAQAAKQSISGTDIPMLFTAVADPVFSQLVPDFNVTEENITGTSNAAPIKENLELFKELKEDIKNIGIIYSIGESNSEIQVIKSKEIAEEIGLNIETVGITSVNDIPQAIDTISKKVEGLYLVTDNMVAASIPLVATLCQEKGLLTVAADASQVQGGILLARGISYHELGKETAIMAKQILVDKKDVSEIPVRTLDKLDKKVNVKTMEALGLTRDLKVFEGAEFIE